MKRHLIRFILVPHLMLATLALFLALGFLFYLRGVHLVPLKGQLSKLEQQSRVHISELASLRERSALSERTSQAQAQLDTLDGRTSGQPSQSVLVAELNAMVRRSNVSVLHGDNRTRDGAAGAVWFLQELSIEGDYTNIRYFLQLLTTYERLLVIEEIDWKAVKTGQQKVRLKLATLFREGR